MKPTHWQNLVTSFTTQRNGDALLILAEKKKLTLLILNILYIYRGWTKKLKHLVLLHNNLLEW